MNRVKKVAEMYEMNQGYVQAIERHERRMYGPSRYSGGRSTIKKVRWYHKLWDEVKEFFSPPKDKVKEAKAKHERVKSHMGKQRKVNPRSFHSRRT